MNSNTLPEIATDNTDGIAINPSTLTVMRTLKNTQSQIFSKIGELEVEKSRLVKENDDISNSWNSVIETLVNEHSLHGKKWTIRDGKIVFLS